MCVTNAACSSLQATWIRNTITNAIRSSRFSSARKVPQNFVYAHPTIRSLIDAVRDILCNKQPADTASQDPAKVKAMLALLDKYGSDFPEPTQPKLGTNGVHDSTTVLVTGTTGRLGCHLLVQLLRSSDVTRVYALNRVSSDPESTLASRQEEAFKRWGIDTSLVSSEKLVLLACDYGADRLGLQDADYQEVPRKLLVGENSD